MTKMSLFNKEIFDREFRTRKFEIEKNQAKELRALVDKHNRDNTIRNSIFLDSHREIKEKHFKEHLKSVIDSLLLSLPEKSKIDNDDRKIIEEILNKNSIGYIEHEKNGLRSAMLSYGHKNNSIFISEAINSLENSLNKVKKYSLYILFLEIEKHNKLNVIKEEIRDTSFWEKYGLPIIIGIIVSVVGGIILAIIV